MANPITKVARQSVDGTTRVRIYHSRVRLTTQPSLPALIPQVDAIWGWALAERHMIQSQMMLEAVSIDKIKTADVEQFRTKEYHSLVAAVQELDGVEYVIASGYALVVFKGERFDWSEIERHIIRLAASFEMDLPTSDTSLPPDPTGE